MGLGKRRRETHRLTRITTLLITARLLGVHEVHLAPYRTKPIASNPGHLKRLIDAHKSKGA